MRTLFAEMAVASMACVLAVSPHADGRAQPPLRVLVDLSHVFSFEVHNGLRSYLSDYEVRSSLEALNARAVARYDVIATAGLGALVGYSSTEIEMLKRFVQRGGGLFIYTGQARGDSHTAALSRAFGIELTEERAQQPVLGLSPGKLGPDHTVEVKLRSASLLRGRGQKVVWSEEGQSVGQAAIYGRGRVIVVHARGFLDKRRVLQTGEPGRNVPLVRAFFRWLGEARAGERRLNLPATRVALVPPERRVRVPGLTVRYPQNLPEEKKQFLVGILPKVHRLTCDEFGYQPQEEREVWALATGGGGFTGGQVCGIGALGSDVVTVSILIHELSNSLCVEAPTWLGDGGWSKLVQIRVKRRMGGLYAVDADRQEQQILNAFREYEDTYGLYDLANGRNWPVGQGKLLTMVTELERRHGEGIMRRYFAAARRYKDSDMLRDVPQTDRIVFYFSVAASEELAPYFRSLGTEAKPIYTSAR